MELVCSQAMTIAKGPPELTQACVLDAQDRSAVALAYHRRTKHRRDGYAAGPETLDWDAQPSPYRHFMGAPVTPLPLVSDLIDTPYAALTGQAAVPPAMLDSRSVGALLELAFGLAAIKEYGPDQWALRCAPSSGNLHPTEAYLLAGGVPGLSDGLHHYLPKDHALEQRCAARLIQPGLWIGLSSILWREAWKYGERAFRYCQLDIGHALGALAAACASLGWRAHVVAQTEHDALERLLGLNRDADFARAEKEEPEVLIHIDAASNAAGSRPAPAPEFDGEACWSGVANRLDPRPMYRWPVIDEVAHASRGTITPLLLHGDTRQVPAPQARAATVIRKRRSAQRYARDHTMPRTAFARMLDAAASFRQGTRLHLIAFVHDVEGLEPGLYALPGSAASEPVLRAALDSQCAWQPVSAMAEIPLLRCLATGDLRKFIRAASCHQAIAADACVSFSILGEFSGPVSANPMWLRQLHWQAGLIGHSLYLEAEASGHSGTGIGCFLDDELHGLFGLKDESFQVLYQFAAGLAVSDARITETLPYPQRSRAEADLVWSGQ